ncbi:hypothetical protein [Roseovarius sp. 2305UL8-3]|uniref:hypothetical protein n=1 Tax=Roseovarius conchicola TaxID=3121636 RepID=UPI003526F060
MARDGYETLTLIWQERRIDVSYEANWLNSGQWHLELRCSETLPVTQTGYRSAFIPSDCISDADAIEPYVLAWLDEAAEDPAWLKHVEDSRQFKLF